MSHCVSGKCAVWLCLLANFGMLSAGAAEFMFRASVRGEVLEGKPLDWDADNMVLLGRDGRFHQFHPSDAKNAVRTSPTFVGYSAAELKPVLAEEFGQAFDVSATKHYLVVHPRGERDQWADRFEELFNRFGHYFRVRGFSVQEPPYPLVAVVFHDRTEYQRHAAASGTPMHPSTLGHYDPLSNRVFLFDATAHSSGVEWTENAETIIHEATHQSAYNAGIHRRFATQPRWLVEGLAMMFEAPGVWNARYDHTRGDRLNRGRLKDFRAYAATRRQPGSLVRLIASDNVFRSDQEGAYAEAWALAFYLSETEPREFANYLARVAGRPLFSDYPTIERIADFRASFGGDPKMLDVRFLRFLAELE
ncbi:MAG: DUF1570 domain-containing protein [Pirellulales bacterium]|nr:DUF1570 domain-containing protein [Pirellulales bacterium]